MIVTFLLLDGYSNFILSCLLEPLRMLKEQYQEEIEWRIVTVDDQPVKSSSHLLLVPSASIQDIESSEILIVVSSNGFRQHVTPENQRLVMMLVRQSRIVIGADAGAWLLASIGLLDDLPATLHWATMADFAETYPQVHISPDRYVMEGRFWSCGGASTALELMLAFITERYGAAKAFGVSSMFMHDRSEPDGQVQIPSALSIPRNSRLNAVLNIMVSTIEHPLSLDELADRCHMSSRTLNRLFKAELGVAPGHYYQTLRLSRARELAQGTTLDLREIAMRCGYNDAAALGKAFRQVYGHSVRKDQTGRPLSSKTRVGRMSGDRTREHPVA